MLSKLTGAAVPVFFLSFSMLCAGTITAQSGGRQADVGVLPVITSLNLEKDHVFKQYLEDVEASRRSLFSQYPKKTAAALAVELVLYSYVPVDDDNIILLSARCNVPEDTLATLNRMQARTELASGRSFLLPSMPGVFLSEEPANDLERLIASGRGENAGVPITIRNADGEAVRMRFIPGDSFTPNERSFYMNPGIFRFPLQNYRITSNFGLRINPISGRIGMHGGLDLAAPAGTPVFSARDGIVAEVGSDAVYGKYVIVSHNGGWTSLYGHLSEINTSLNSRVKSGTIVGRVGSTGLSTGPHLHFEIREHGKLQDPRSVLKKS